MIHSIFVSRVFPVCYIGGVGQTTFKIISEYIIIAILSGSLIMLRKRRAMLDKKVFQYIEISIVLTIFSEFAFTQYVS